MLVGAAIVGRWVPLLPETSSVSGDCYCVIVLRK